jgi:hypothetical protein
MLIVIAPTSHQVTNGRTAARAFFFGERKVSQSSQVDSAIEIYGSCSLFEAARDLHLVELNHSKFTKAVSQSNSSS